MQNSFWRQTRNRPMPHHQLRHETKHIKFQIVLLLEKIQMLQKKVKVAFGTASSLHFCKKKF